MQPPHQSQGNAADAGAETNPEPNTQRLVAQLNRLVGATDGQTVFRCASGRFLAAILGCALYGLAAGFFQGGWTLALATLKAPLIVLASLLLCAPSLFVTVLMTGGETRLRECFAAVAGFAAIVALVLLGAAPVAWLFSVTSTTELFVVWLHLGVWTSALILGRPHLRALLGEAGARPPTGPWLLLLWFVSLQMATYLRPVLSRAPNESFIASEKLSFLDQFVQLFN